MVANNATIPEAGDQGQAPVFCIPPDRIGDPQAYVEAVIAVTNAMGRGELKTVDVSRQVAVLRELCESSTGVALADATRDRADAIATFTDLMDLSEAHLLKLESAIQKITDIRVTEDVKKKWIALIHRTITLQRECRADPAKFGVYVFRDQQDDSIIHLQPFHLRLFDAWNGPQPNSVAMVAPGHGKTTCLRMQLCWEIGDNPTYRHLVLFDEKGKPEKEIPLLRQSVKSRRFRAIFPNIRVLGQKDDTEESKSRFTVLRPNLSREPTVEGYSVRSAIQGSGYDRIWPDDICPQEVRWNQSLREEIHQRWSGVVKERIRNPKVGRIRMIATPWHEDDVPDRMIHYVEEGRANNWTVCLIPILDDPATGKAISIWPERFDCDYYEQKKPELGSNYTLSYRLRAREKREHTVQRVMFYDAHCDTQWTDENDRRLREFIHSPAASRFLSVDPAATGNKWSSRTGVIDAVVTPRGWAHVLDVDFLQLGPGELVNWLAARIFEAERQGHPYETIFIEAQGAIKGQVHLSIQILNDKLAELGCLRPPTFADPGVRLMGKHYQNMGKMSRLREAAPAIENGTIRFPGRYQWNYAAKKRYLSAVEGSSVHQLIEHLMNFEAAAITDGVDGLTQFLLQIRGRLRNPFTSDAEPKKAAPTAFIDPLTAAAKDQAAKSLEAFQNNINEYQAEQELLGRKYAGAAA